MGVTLGGFGFPFESSESLEEAISPNPPPFIARVLAEPKARKLPPPIDAPKRNGLLPLPLPLSLLQLLPLVLSFVWPPRPDARQKSSLCWW